MATKKKITKKKLTKKKVSKKKKVNNKKVAKKKTKKKSNKTVKSKVNVITNKKGRPTKYKEEFNNMARKACELGATDWDLAELFNVNKDTIYEWQKVYPEFSDSIKEGKKETNNLVKKSLLHRALGYSHDDTHVSNYKGFITITPLTKHYPPDTNAASLWLRNRDPENWRNDPKLNDNDDVEPTAISYEVAEAVKDVRVTIGKKQK